MTKKTRQQVIEIISNLKINNMFDPYISSVTFPYFKNYEYFSKLTLDFPLTVLVGKNGVGKSSALQALYGSPEGSIISNFWFSTVMDPIEEFGDINEPHSFYYEYQNSKKKYEVLYTRRYHINRKSEDYWETSRGRKKYRMKKPGIRFKNVNKNLVYLDFRSQLSAFDKFFYFGNVDGLKSNTKQDYLRIKSKYLHNSIMNDTVQLSNGKVQNKLVIDLSSKELELISNILGEQYLSGKIIEHKFFDTWGTSVLLTRNDFSYSEAHAGSGEIAVVMLVHKIVNLPTNSLILLDEPEVSLHPGAQKKLLEMLLEQILHYKHQIVIATHSPSFTEGLPKTAIKKFVTNRVSKKTEIYNQCFPSEAFTHLGYTSKLETPTIHVEDILMKNIIDEIILKNKLIFNDIEIDIYFSPGGASNIFLNSIPQYSQEIHKKHFVYFDGDQQPKVEIECFSDRKVETLNEKILSNHIFEITNCKVEFVKDGGEGLHRTDQIISAQLEYLKYLKNCVKYLPVQTPEDLIWDFDYVKKILGGQVSDEKIDEIDMMDTSKKKIYLTSKIHSFNDNVDVNDVNLITNLLIKNWLRKEDEYQEKIINDLLSFIEYLNLNR